MNEPKQSSRIYQALQWMRARFRNVWVDKYPFYWHIFDVVGGFVIALIFVLVYEKSSDIGLRIGWFFAIWVISYVVLLAASYGVVRARNGWTKKRS